MLFSGIGLLEGADGFLDELHGLAQLLLVDAERRGEADDVLVGGFGQHTEVAHLDADIPSLLAVVGLDDDGVQETLAAHLLDEGRLEVAHLLAENLSEAVGILHQAFLLDDLQGGDGDLGGDGVAAEGGTVLAGLDVEHDVVVGQHGADRHHAATEGLAQNDDVGTHTLVVAGQHLAGAGNAALHLVGHEQNVVFLADVVALLEVALIGDIDARLALDGLQQETSHLGAVLGQHLLQRVGIVVGDAQETGGHGAVVGVALGVVAHGDDGDGAAVEVALAADNHHLVVGDALLHHAPATGQLQSRLVGLGAGVHRQHLVVAEVLGYILLPLAETIIIERARREGQLVGLVAHGLDNLGVAMALVDSAVGRQEVEILLAFHIPHENAFAFGEHNGQRVIIVGAILGFHLHELL